MSTEEQVVKMGAALASATLRLIEAESRETIDRDEWLYALMTIQRLTHDAVARLTITGD